MPRKRVKSKRRRQSFVPDWQWHYLCYGVMPDDIDDGAGGWWACFFRHGGPSGTHYPGTISEAWALCKNTLLEQWITEKPGTRPWVWWQLDGPRWVSQQFEGWYVQGKLSEPRNRLGGTGTPQFECLNFSPSLRFGIPDLWVRAWVADYYNGRLKNIHGNPIGTQYEEGHFKGLPIDPDNPPVYETEASYLKRHDLLTDDEVGMYLDYDGSVSVVDLEFLDDKEVTVNRIFYQKSLIRH